MLTSKTNPILHSKFCVTAPATRAKLAFLMGAIHLKMHRTHVHHKFQPKWVWTRTLQLATKHRNLRNLPLHIASHALLHSNSQVIISMHNQTISVSKRLFDANQLAACRYLYHSSQWKSVGQPKVYYLILAKQLTLYKDKINSMC